MDLTPFFRSILEQDRAPVVVCDLNHTIIYMNRAALERYSGRAATVMPGMSLLDCHDLRSREIIGRVLEWFSASIEHNIVYEYRNDEENKDVYMVALRNDDGTLIGYYEKHEYRNHESGKLYDLYD